MVEENAFPVQLDDPVTGDKVTILGGLTVRDCFALAAMHAVLSNPRFLSDNSNSCVAERCYELAEEMMRERKK